MCLPLRPLPARSLALDIGTAGPGKVGLFGPST
jgi:hypothetical protein